MLEDHEGPIAPARLEMNVDAAGASTIRIEAELAIEMPRDC
jgi:hypothetical protein